MSDRRIGIFHPRFSVRLDDRVIGMERGLWSVGGGFHETALRALRRLARDMNPARATSELWMRAGK